MHIKTTSYFIIYLILVSIGCTSTTQTNELQKEQMQMMAVLSGVSEITQGKTLKGRFDIEDKQLTRNYISDQLKGIGRSPQEHTYDITITYDDTPRNYKGTNIYTIIPATTPSEEYILIGAHYDAVQYSPGANDNASGCALVYGIAKHISALQTRTKNIMIVFFDQEEFGLIGSRAFAQFIKGENYNIHSVHTVDQMGWDNDNDKAIELELPTAYLNTVYQKHAKELKLSAFKTDVASTDHSSFRYAGYNAIGLTEEYKNGDTTPHYHQSSDTYDTINFEYLSSSTEFMYRVIRELITL